MGAMLEDPEGQKRPGDRGGWREGQGGPSA
jgi:hypothetical protein